MLSFIIDNDDIKSFMNCLLKGSVFDSFEIREVQIQGFVTLSFNGLLAHNVAEKTQPKRFFALWQEVKPLCFDFIKGRSKPKSIKIVFSKSVEFTDEFHPNAAALFLNLNYENDVAAFTAATSQKEFALNKDIDYKWEEYIVKFFANNNLHINL